MICGKEFFGYNMEDNLAGAPLPYQSSEYYKGGRLRSPQVRVKMSTSSWPDTCLRSMAKGVCPLVTLP